MFKRLFLGAAMAAAILLSAQAQADVGTEFVVSGTASVSGTTGSSLTIYTLPANGGSYVLCGADVAVLSGSAVSASPTIAIEASGTALTSNTVLSGTTPETVTRPSLVSPLPIVVTGTNPVPITVNVITAGTATQLNVQTAIRGYWLQ